MKTSDKSHRQEHEHAEHHAEHAQAHAHEHKSAEHITSGARHETQHEMKTAGKEPEKKAEPKAMPNSFMIVSVVVIVLLLAIIVILLLRKPVVPGAGTGDGNGTIDSKDKVKVEFYVMSQCPYGTQVEAGIAPVIEAMGESIDFHLDYILQESSPGVFQSLHGDKEVKGNIAQLCVMKYYPDNKKFMKFILCQNKDVQNVDVNWEACAKENSMDYAKIQACFSGEEGQTLLRESMQKATARQARGSPTMFIADSPYTGQRDALSFQRAICKYSQNQACADIPKCATDADCTEQPTKEGSCNNPGTQQASCTYTDPVKVDLIILNDANCGAACDTTNIVQVSSQLFLGVNPRSIDVNSADGKALVLKYNISIVPAYIFDKSVVQTKTWQQRADLQTAFEKLSDDSYKLLDSVTGASYFVSEEKRKAHYDSLGITLSDNKPQIDFFVMSYCPYGNQAEEGIEPAYQLLKAKADFKPHYVIYENYGGGGSDYCLDDGKLCSMHGIQELNQNIREACVEKYMGLDQWFAFVLAMNKQCTSQNADSCWEPVATGLKLDIAKIKTCQADEGVALMAAEKELDAKFGASGSPSIYIDGDEYSGGRTPEDFKTALCAKFTTVPSECSTVLEGSTAATATASGSC